MRKARLISFVTILTVLLSAQMCFSVQRSVSQPRTVDLSTEQLENVKIDVLGITSFFADLSLTYNIPVGLETAPNEPESARYYVELKKGTVVDLLRQFVTHYSQYAWKIEDGVVNVFPLDRYRDIMSKDMLAVKIDKFSVKEKTSCWNFVASLLTRRETKAILQANNTTYSRRSPSGFYIPQLGRNFTLNVSNLTIRSLLNRLITKSPNARFWVVSRLPDRTFFLDVSAQPEDSLKTKGKRPLEVLFGENPKP